MGSIPINPRQNNNKYMVKFPNHKIILECGEDEENCLNRIEIDFNSQICLDDLLNQVFRPILIGLGYTNNSINESFNMTEFGEDLGDNFNREMRKSDNGFDDDLTNCEDLDTNEI